MWRRLRRKTFAPRRPVLYPDQAGLLLLTCVAIAGGIAAVIVFLH